MKKISFYFSMLILVSSLHSCYYDIEEELYPNYGLNSCDTNNITFLNNIEPILKNSCYNCHGIGVNLGNVTLEGFSNLQISVSNGSLLGSLNHESGYSPMPKGGTKLNNCGITMVRSWINQGAQNN